MTNISSSGVSVITVTKEVTHVIALVTKLVTADRIASIDYTPLQTNQTLDQADAKTNKGHNNKGQNQRIGDDDSSEGRHPFDCLSNEGRDVPENSSDSNSSSSEKTFFQYILLRLIRPLATMNIDNGLEQGHSHKEKTKTHEITNGFSHKEVRQVREKPHYEVHHFLHKIAPPSRNTQ